MNKSLRKAVIAGNWKMNKTYDDAVTLINEIISANQNPPCEVILCVPYIYLTKAVELTKGTKIKVGAQNINDKDSGAYTGEISPVMLKNIGVEYTIIGHSERRQYYNETDVSVNLKIKSALNHGLNPIVCVGESLTQREQGVTAEHIAIQTKIALMDISKDDMKNIIIAYEPIWAIGTGKTATSDQADEVCKIIRDVVSNLYDKATADALTIQYGGSMNAANAAELLSKVNVDGGLIGGAALKSDDFTKIINAANQ